jgi:hypothetical protein
MSALFPSAPLWRHVLSQAEKMSAPSITVSTTTKATTRAK